MFDYLRKLYGEVYVTSLPDGRDIPWKPLSYGDFVYYTELFQEGRLAKTILEDEIFIRCVTDKAIADRLDILPAGTIQTVVAHIMQHSGPSTVDEFNNALAEHRKRVDNPLHFIITIICRAFPGYMPEDIYKLDYDTIMLRLAQSEKMLMDANILTEPIVLYNAGEVPVQEKVPPPELKSAWEAATKFKDLNPPSQLPGVVKTERSQSPPEIRKNRQKPRASLPKPKHNMPVDVTPVTLMKKPEGWDMKKSPVLQKKGNINIVQENQDIDNASSGARSGWDMIDEPLIKKQVADDAKIIYKDLLAELAKKKK